MAPQPPTTPQPQTPARLTPLTPAPVKKTSPAGTTGTTATVWILSTVVVVLIAALLVVGILFGTGTIGSHAHNSASSAASQSETNSVNPDRFSKKSGSSHQSTGSHADDSFGPSQTPQEIVASAQNGDFSPIAGTYCSTGNASNCLAVSKTGHITGTNVTTFSGESHDIDSTVTTATNDVFTFTSHSPNVVMALNPPASDAVCHHDDGSTTTGKQCVIENSKGTVLRPQIDKPDYYLYFFRNPSMTRAQYLSGYKGLEIDGSSSTLADSEIPNGKRPFIVVEPSFYHAQYRTASEVFYLQK